MPTLVFGENSYECSRAIKGVDYIKLYDENDAQIIAFHKISDFSAFTLQGGAWEKGVSTDIVGANAELIGGDIHLTLIGSVSIETGLTITFKAPCNCTEVKNIIIQGTAFNMVNAAGVQLASNFEAFKTGAVITITLNLANLGAYIQNGAASQVENGGTGASTPEGALENLGTKRIVTGSYKGTGTSGPTVKVQIPIDSLPEFMIIKGSSIEVGLFVRTSGVSYALAQNNDTTSYLNGLTCSYSDGIFSFSVWRTDSPQAALNRAERYVWTAILS